MKKNIIWIIALAIIIYCANILSFVPQGLEAQAAADQVKTGAEYLQARGEMKVYAAFDIIESICWFFIGWNIAGFFLKYFKIEKNK